ncbi:hypothetical protein D3C87_1024780 [compost metagenome]
MRSKQKAFISSKTRICDFFNLNLSKDLKIQILVLYVVSSAHFSKLNLLTELLTSSMLFYAYFGTSEN